MTRSKRWLLGISLGLAALVSAKVLLFDLAADPADAYVINLAQLHAAAVSAGPLPSSIEVEHVADFAFPRALVVAGENFSMHPMVLLSHRVVWPDRSVVIDTAMNEQDAAGIPGAKFDQAAYGRVQKALPNASGILFTHEHPDHVGGVARAGSFDRIAEQVWMTREQFNGPKLERDLFPSGTLETLRTLEYSGLHVPAPGIVLQKAPGHSTGTQLIYVELASGARYLFVGDIAWSEDNIRLARGRPGIATLLMKEDRPAVAAQLVALRNLPKDVHVVVAHDPVAYERDLAAGLFKRGFSE